MTAPERDSAPRPAGPTFRPLDDVEYGRVDRVGPMLRRVIAENPSKFTYRGTGTYIVGEGEVAVVDPGPLLDAHRDALAAALAGERVTAICVTHCHSDHSPLAAWLKDETGAPTYAFGPHPPPDPDDPAVAEELAEEIGEGVKVEESIDLAFVPDVAVGDGAVAARGPGWTLRGVHTPGHTSNHLCFAFEEEGVLFPGDHVMGWSTTVVSPPDGDMAAYIDSLRKVAGRADATYWPTHGPSIPSPQEYVAALVEHRLERERQVLDAVRSGLGQIPAIVALLYADVAAELHKPAGRSVLSHLAKLVDDGLVRTADGAGPRLGSSYEPT
jgi:glyoxylase-like metal-dependent hydrolase (beta-lactamase superfamily II)